MIDCTPIVLVIDVTAVLGIFLEANKHQNLKSLKLPTSENFLIVFLGGFFKVRSKCVSFHLVFDPVIHFADLANIKHCLALASAVNTK